MRSGKGINKITEMFEISGKNKLLVPLIIFILLFLGLGIIFLIKKNSKSKEKENKEKREMKEKDSKGLDGGNSKMNVNMNADIDLNKTNFDEIKQLFVDNPNNYRENMMGEETRAVARVRGAKKPEEDSNGRVLNTSNSLVVQQASTEI